MFLLRNKPPNTFLPRMANTDPYTNAIYYNARVVLVGSAFQPVISIPLHTCCHLSTLRAFRVLLLQHTEKRREMLTQSVTQRGWPPPLHCSLRASRSSHSGCVRFHVTRANSAHRHNEARGVHSALRANSKPQPQGCSHRPVLSLQL